MFTVKIVYADKSEHLLEAHDAFRAQSGAVNLTVPTADGPAPIYLGASGNRRADWDKAVASMVPRDQLDTVIYIMNSRGSTIGTYRL